MPVRNGSASLEALPLGRQRTVGAPRPAVAAAVVLLVVAVDDPPPELPVALPVPLLDPVRVAATPLSLDIAAVPVLTTAPMPVVDAVALCGTELIAVVPVVSAPVPATVPAVAAPPPPPPPLVEPLDVVAMAFGAGGAGLVLLSVPEGVVAAPSGGFVAGDDGVNVGSVTKPPPTWPAPPEPGVDPPTGSLTMACCARAGVAAAAESSAMSAIAVLTHRQRGPRPAVPDGIWPARPASARVGAGSSGV